METASSTSSDDKDESQIYCEPCQSADDICVLAEGFCQTCEEYLCHNCFKYHRLPTPSKHHVLLEMSQVSRQPVRQQKVRELETETGNGVTCSSHVTKTVEFYCHKHALAVCGVCAYSKHKNCKAVYLPDLAKHYKKGAEFRYLTNSLDDLENMADQCLNTATSNLDTVKESSANAVYEISRFRMEINNYLDKKEGEVLSLANKLFKENEDVIKQQMSNLKMIKHQITNMKAKLADQDCSEEDLFMCAKDAQVHVQKLGQKLDEFLQQNKPVYYIFKREKGLEEELLSQRGLGVLHIFPQSTEPKSRARNRLPKLQIPGQTANVSQLIDIHVKMAGNKDCKISGMAVLSPQTLLLVDRNNKCVKHVDTTIFAIVAWRPFASYPWDITALDKSTAAVTFPACEQIQIISATGGLSRMRTFDVNGDCRGISSTSDSLIVTYNSPPKVEIMDHYGTVYQTLRTDDKGKALFQCPSYVIAKSEGNDVIFYVSDSITNTVTKHSTSGHVLANYHTSSEPKGLATLPNGNFLVCNRYSQEIVMVTPEGKTCKLLGASSGIQYPISVCYCAVRNAIYVSNYRPFENDEVDNVVSVFKLR